MEFKLLVIISKEDYTEDIVDVARTTGYINGLTIIPAQGKGIRDHDSILGLDLTAASDVILFVLESECVCDVLDVIKSKIPKYGEAGTAISFVIPVQDVFGLRIQEANIIKTKKGCKGD